MSKTILTYRQKDEFRDYFVSEVMGLNALEESISWIQKNLYPEDVFEESQLSQWAEEKDYVKNKEAG
jgi:hypothetical protein